MHLFYFTTIDVDTVYILCMLDTSYSCNMGKSGLPDIYTQSTRATGPRAKDVYIRQTTSAHGIAIMCHLVMGHKHTYVINIRSKD